VLTQTQEKYDEVLQVAENLYRQGPDWITFFREVLGIDGVVRRAFPSLETLVEFEKSEQFDQIQQCLVKLREKRSISDPENEPTRVITVRLPKSMHEYLRTEAHDLRTSMNKLCISKLLQVIDEGKIPNEKGATTRLEIKPAAQPAQIPVRAAVATGMGVGGQDANNQQYNAQPAPALGQRTQPLPPLKPVQPRF
jgi:predicted HicB family RNase H-like nuclease